MRELALMPGTGAPSNSSIDVLWTNFTNTSHIMNDVMRVPMGCHVLGLLNPPNTQTHGTPTAAAKCIGPLSCPTKHIEFRIAAALSRGDSRPHRFTLGPTQFAVSLSERSNSSVEPIILPPTGHTSSITISVDGSSCCHPVFTCNLST